MRKLLFLSFVSVLFVTVGVVSMPTNAHAKGVAMPPSCNAAVQIFPGDGAGDGPELDYQDNLDGTFTDCNTKYMWEIKTDDDSIHNVDNTYSWSTNAFDPNGTLFEVFLDQLNDVAGGGVNCFAGHCDWRIPNGKELQSIVDYSTCSGCNGGTSASSVPGETAASGYWSVTTSANFPNNAWFVNFFRGFVGSNFKNSNHFARAVRP